MQTLRTANLRRALSILAGVLILKVTLSVVWGYRDYLPPNFKSDFLVGRESYFFGAYQWAFYTHIAAGPLTLIFGLVLISDRFRIRFPKWHRSLGKIQVALVLLLLVPSGLWMARYAATGTVAGIGLAVLAILTGLCILLGWRSAVRRRFVEHRRWMWRCFVLLCSAVVLRLIGGFVTVTNVGSDWSYPLATWVSWIIPLVAFELSVAMKQRFRRSRAGELGGSHSSTFSLPPMEISARR